MTFDQTTEAIRAEKLLAEAGLCPLVMPLPSQIRAGCGLCLRVKPQARELARATLASYGVRCAGWFLRRPGDRGSLYEPLKEEEP